MFFSFIIDLCFLIAPGIAQIFVVAAELAIPTGVPKLKKQKQKLKHIM